MGTFWFLMTFVIVGGDAYQPVITPRSYSSQTECMEAGQKISAISEQTVFYSCQPWNVEYGK